MKRLAQSLPREPSVAGMIVFSGLGGLVLAGYRSTAGLAAAIAGILVHLFTFDKGFYAFRFKKYRVLALILALNLAPYFSSLVLYSSWIETLAVLSTGTSIIGFHLYLAKRLGAQNPYVYISGAAIPVLPALSAPLLATGELAPRSLLFWAILTLYSATTAAYVETRLAFRKYSPKKTVALWLPSFLGALYCPYTLLALAEPTAKLAVNVKKRGFVSKPREIKMLGVKELARLSVFTAILVAVLALCRNL